MKRYRPLLLVVIGAVLLAVVFGIPLLRAKACIDEGGAVVAPLTRAQSCTSR
ncbi:MAG: hypothetical protein IBJ13_03000 [Sphingopyxis sp.]|nr:hypothetical protein [Sphingopyxis sp.]